MQLLAPTILPTIALKVTHSVNLSSFYSLFILLLCLSQTAQAAMPIRNYNPVAQSIGMMSFQSEGLIDLNSQQRHAIHTDLVISNQFALPENGDTIYFDLESYHFNLNYQYRFKDWQLGIETRYISFTEGFLDSFIDGWHEFWNMPDAGRSQVERNHFELYINAKDTDGELYHSQKPISGLGDTRIHASWPFAKNIIWVNQIKLPTESETYLGSGSVDLATAMHHSFKNQNYPLNLQLQYGLSLVGKRDWLEEDKQPIIAQFGLALDYEFLPKHNFGLQMDAHSETYKASSNTLSEEPFGAGVIATISYRYDGPAWQFRSAIVEDLLPDSAPDVSFLFGFSSRF